MREGWIYKNLGECFPYIKNGANIKQIKGAKGYPITRIETLSGGVFNRDRMGYADIFDINKFQDYVLGNGDLLMSHINSKAYIGRTVQYTSQNEEVIIHGMNLLRLKSNEQLIQSSFFKYYTDSRHFKSDIARIRKDAVNQSSFAISDLRLIVIPVPSLYEQQSIVTELDKINELISFKKAQLSDLDSLALSIFYEMFGDPVENEKGWQVKKLSEVSTLLNGRAYKQNELLNEGKYKVLRVGNFFTNSNYYYSNLELEDNKYCDNGDLLFAWSASFGAFIWSGEKVIYHYHIWKVLYDESSLNKLYYCYLLNTMTNSFMNDLHGIGMMHLTKVGMEQYHLPLPPLSLQQDFARRIEVIEKQKVQISSTIKDLETLYASRMQYWFD